MTARPPVLCAQPFGYGPAAKVLAVAEQLTARGVRPVLLAEGIAHELLSRSPQCGEIVEAAPDDDQALDLLRGASVVLSVMHREYAKLALDLGKSLHVADSLSWLRDPTPTEFLEARRYWVQSFPGVSEHARTLDPPATVVGPILSPAPTPAPTDRVTGLVVSLGGFDSPYAEAGDDDGYVELAIRSLLDAGLSEAIPGETVILSGARCAEDLSERYKDSDLTFASLPHSEAARLRAEAAVILTAPGLTSTLEAFRSGVPTFFLPPQSASQWWILARLRSAGVAPHALHWADLAPPGTLDEGTPIPQRISIVRSLIADFSGDLEAVRRLRESLQEIASHPCEELVRAQRAFFLSLGTDGAETLATSLIEDASTSSHEEHTT